MNPFDIGTIEGLDPESDILLSDFVTTDGIRTIKARDFSETSINAAGTIGTMHLTGDVTNNYDPNPDDNVHQTTFVYLIRENGELRIEHDHHVCGIFTLDVWRDLLREAGFEVNEEDWGEQVDTPSDVPIFACLKH